MNPPDTDPRIEEIWEEVPKVFGTARADLLMELADHLMEAERHSEAVPVLETSQDLYIEAGLEWLAGRAAHNLGVALGHLHRGDEQMAAERRSIDFFEQGQRRELAGCSRMALGFQLRAAGRLNKALAVFKEALHDFVASSEPVHAGNAAMAVLEAEVDLGRFPTAARLLRPTLDLLATTAPVAIVARLHELAAQVLGVRKGAEAAQKALRRARAVWDALDEADDVARCDIGAAVLLIGGDGSGAATATTTLHKLRLERQEAGDPAGVAGCDRGIGLASLAANQPDRALASFEDAAAVFQACGLLGDAAECDTLTARALVDLDRPAEARRKVRRALPTLAAYHRPRVEVDARLTLAALLLAAGEPKAALREAKRAESIARRGLLDPQLDQARFLRHEAERSVAGGALPPTAPSPLHSGSAERP